jgi:hypothetical protein
MPLTHIIIPAHAFGAPGMTKYKISAGKSFLKVASPPCDAIMALHPEAFPHPWSHRG